MRFQQKDKSLIEIAKEKPNDSSIKQFHGAGKTDSLICKHEKNCDPKTNTNENLVEWCHNVLCHPGRTRTKLSIGQHCYWKGLQKLIYDISSKCHMCQFLQRGKRNHGKLPPKQAKTIHGIRYVISNRQISNDSQ